MSRSEDSAGQSDRGEQNDAGEIQGHVREDAARIEEKAADHRRTKK